MGGVQSRADASKTEVRSEVVNAWRKRAQDGSCTGHFP